MIRRRRGQDARDVEEGQISPVAKDDGKKHLNTTKRPCLSSSYRRQRVVLFVAFVAFVAVTILVHECYYFTILNGISIPLLHLARPSNVHVARIAVVSMHRGTKFVGYLGRWLRSTKQSFAAQHSYAYLDEMPPESSLYPLAPWQRAKAIYFDKLRMLLHILETYENLEFVLWLDGDAVVANPRISIENKISNMTNNSSFCMIWTSDSTGPNAGVLLLANSAETRAFLRESLSFVPKDKVFADQAALTEIAASNPTYSNCIIRLSHSTLLQSRVRGKKGIYKPGDWILHLPNHNRWELLRSLSSWLARKKKKECQQLTPLSPPDLSALTNKRRERYQAVQRAIKHAWQGYAGTRFRFDDVDPVTGIGSSWLYHSATLHDSLDTLYLANMTEEYNEAVRAATSVDIQSTAMMPTKTFEYSLRVIGGLLGAYSVSGDDSLLQAAAKASDSVLAGPFGWSPTALPRMYDILAPQRSGLVALVYRLYSFFYRWGRDAFTQEHKFNSLAGVGSFSVEFNFLSRVTGEYRFQSASNAVFQHVVRHINTDGMVPNVWNVMTGRPSSNATGLASGGDSFYEYLLKAPLMNDCGPLNSACQSSVDREMLQVYHLMASKSLAQHHIMRMDGKTYPVDGSRFHHLLCFLPGLLSLENNTSDWTLRDELMSGCQDTYSRTTTGLGPEQVKLDEHNGYAVINSHYFLRPEYIESLFVVYRRTGNDIFQDMAWDIFLSIEKYCKTTHGYNGLKNVDDPGQGFAGVMPSYFLAETLKYFLLLFGPDDYLSLDDFVLTTEAHPLRRRMPEGACPIDGRRGATPTPWMMLFIIAAVTTFVTFILSLVVAWCSPKKTNKKMHTVEAR